ncbi:MAG: hypothetical protein HZB18_10685 [Chloroflexi bacterium]|nr:hypothetical protein [Chloroflexota bacterium]
MAGVSGTVCLKGKPRQVDACDECAPECPLFAGPSLEASEAYSDMKDEDAAEEGELKKSTKKFVMFMM